MGPNSSMGCISKSNPTPGSLFPPAPQVTFSYKLISGIFQDAGTELKEHFPLQISLLSWLLHMPEITLFLVNTLKKNRIKCKSLQKLSDSCDA